MTTDALVPVRVNQVSAGSHLRWAEGMSFSLPKSVLDSSGLGKHVDQAGNLNLPSEIAPIALDHVRALRLRAAFTERPPASSRMPISYQNVPHWARTAIASVI